MAMERATNHPFTRPTADVTVTSADSVNFRVHMAILSEASPVFAKMFSQPHKLAKTAHPAFSVAEDSATLEALFRLCYPIRDPTLGTLREVCATLIAALKYQMAEAVEVLRARFVSLAPSDPLWAYTAACHLALEDAARAAAVEICNQGLWDAALRPCSSPDFRQYSASAVLRLMVFCLKTGKKKEGFTFLRPKRHRSPDTGNRGIARNAIQKAPYPFDTDSADLILRSSDRVDFHVHKAIIDMASSLISRMASYSGFAQNWGTAPGRQEAWADDLPVDALPTNVEDVLSALTAARKYGMAKATDLLAAQLLSLPIVPLHAFLIACRLNMRAHALKAARRTLSQKEAFLLIYHPEMEDAPAETYQRLRLFYTGAGAQLDEFLCAYVAPPEALRARLWRACLSPRGRIRAPPRSLMLDDWPARQAEMSVACWFSAYVEELLWKLREGMPPLGAAKAPSVLHGAMAAAAERGACSACRGSGGLALMMEFAEFLSGEITVVIDRYTQGYDWGAIFGDLANV
ncbi:uncharacterized protein FIBRA_09310 [Fibroporia radiculosa]|uniref:BTB domain-containing protein n=1 Tax=Fibroporia radiculosa TaxID=599839 RepID=J7SCX3_9APHY|nr:uncharacterized protein FIBRA_09310 [Fibroporia radiculosa]CCM06993.1 predicted protein [Fibroporia radiculosa]